MKIEKTLVVLLCTVIFFVSYRYFAKNANDTANFFLPARKLLQVVPEGKKVMPMLANRTYCSHIDAYYVIDRDGYVPSLFSMPYMIVQYAKKPEYSPNARMITPEMIGLYDYIFVWGDNQKVEGSLQLMGFFPYTRCSVFGVYQNRR